MKSLRAHISEKLRLDPRSIECRNAFIETLSYLTGGMSAFDYQKTMHEYCTADISAKQFRMSLLEHRYYSLELKLCCFALSRAKPIEYNRVYRIYGVSPDDRPWISQALAESKQWRSRMKKRIKNASHGIDIGDIDLLFSMVYPDLLKHCKRIAYKKLRFIYENQNLKQSDFVSDMMCRCVQALYKLVPTHEDAAYVTNYLRRAATNHAQNIIKANTTEGRGRLVSTNKENTKFSLVVVSQNQINAMTEDGSVVDYETLGTPVESKFELQLSIKEILERYKGRRKTYQFLMCQLGVVDKAFTQWLRENGFCSNSADNADFQLKVTPEKYTKCLSRFLQVAETKAFVFLSRLKEELGYAHGNAGLRSIAA